MKGLEQGDEEQGDNNMMLLKTSIWEEGKAKVVDPPMTKRLFTPSLYALVQKTAD